MESQDVSDECNVASSNYRFDKNEAETRLAVERSMMRDKGTSERQQTYKIDMPYNKGHNHNLYVSNHPQDPTDEKNDYHIEIVDASQSNEIDEGDQPDENPDEQPKDIEESERNHSSQLENEMSQVILGFHESDVFHLATCYSDYHVATGLEDLIQTLRIDRESLPTDLEDLRGLMREVVTKQWHPLYLAIMADKPTTPLKRDDFIELCEHHAPMELQGASTIPKASLGLLSTHSSIRIARHTDYSNLCHTIACTLALYDEQKSVQKQKQHVDYLLSLKCDLLMRQNRCVNQLAKALCGVDLSPLAALHNAPVPVHNAIVLPKKKRLVSALKFPTRESTFILREVGLTDEVLEALALYFGYHKEGQLTAIADEVASLQLLWNVMQSNLEPMKLAVKELVTLKWHPWHQNMMYNSIRTYEDFIIVCQEYAKEEFDLAQSAEEQDKLKFIITSSGTRKVPKSDYNDIPLTIAYALAQHDPAYNLEGIRNENYINAIDSALSSKRDLAMNTVFKQVFKVDLKAVKAAAAVGSSSAADSRYPHSVPAAKQGQNEESKKDNSSNQEQSVSAPTLSTVSAAIVEEMEYGVMHEEVVMEMEKWGVTHEPIVMNAGITDPTAAEPSAGLADSVSLNYDDVDGGNQSDPASDSTDDDVVIIEEVNQSVDDVVIQTSPDVQSSSVTDSLRPMQQEGKTNIAAISREDASPSISLRGVIVPVSPVVELLLPHKDDLSVLLEAGLTQDVLNKIAQQCCQDQVGLLSDLEEEVSTLVINRLALQGNLKVTIASLNSLVMMHWHPWHAAMVLNLVLTYDQFLAVCARYAQAELVDAMSENAQSQLSFVVTSGLCTAMSPNYNNIPLIIAYAIALNDSAEVLKDIQNENFIVTLRNALLSRCRHAVYMVAKSVLKIELAGTGTKEQIGSIVLPADTSGAPQDTVDQAALLPLFPIYEPDIAQLETQYYHFYMQSPQIAAKFMYQQCLELLDKLHRLPASRRDKVRSQLASKYGKVLEAEGEDITRVNERLWHNYLKWRCKLKKSEGVFVATVGR